MDVVTMYDYLNKQMMDPFVIITIIIVLVVFFIISLSLGSGNSEVQGFSVNGESNSSSQFVSFVVFILIILLLVNVLYFVYKIDIIIEIRKFLKIEDKSLPDEKNEKGEKSEKDEKSKNSENSPKPISNEHLVKNKKQVFNIPGNYYTYDNAKAVCAAFNAELATYDQIEKAYADGAEWCNYGWSADQLALFPTQKNTYDILKSKPGRENDCGRPGINGGYIANPNVQFGVNCYGVKPPIKSEEAHIMQTVPPYPETAEEIAFQKKVDTMRQNIDKILLSPFNHTSWNQN